MLVSLQGLAFPCAWECAFRRTWVPSVALPYSTRFQACGDVVRFSETRGHQNGGVGRQGGRILLLRDVWAVRVRRAGGF